MYQTIKISFYANIYHFGFDLGKHIICSIKGSGVHGQLGQGSATLSLLPSIVEDLLIDRVYAAKIYCGSHHNAMISRSGELYTWGTIMSIGRGLHVCEGAGSFTPHPKRCAGFGSINGRIGRGLPRTVACGKEFTIVATYPYRGPNEEDAKELMKEQDESTRQHKLKKEENNKKGTMESKERRKWKAKYEEVKLLTSTRLCSVDQNCPGFQVHALKPSICRECGHSQELHTIIAGTEERMCNIQPKAGDILHKKMGYKALSQI
mmetsp:Transcript_4707/g.5647  ORF Transcript_4707/g.5647 Transcript_4707/m.5647 type:complete len:263 (-) Transcript_4707:306-1094(-)